MGSLTLDGVWFIAYSQDHDPPHVHGFYGEVEVIVDLCPRVAISRRKFAIRPSKAKKKDVRRILRAAKQNADALLALWEKARGND